MKRSTQISIAIGATLGAYLTFVQYNRYVNKRIVDNLVERGDDFIADILMEYAKRIYDFLYEMSQTSCRVRKNLEQKNIIHMISDEDLHRMLLPQESMDVFRKIETELLEEHNVTLKGCRLEKVIEEQFLNTANPSEKVAKCIAGLKTMIHDTLAGNVPILMGCAVPMNIRSDQALQIQDAILRAKRHQIAEVFQRGTNDNDLIGDEAITEEITQLTKEIEVSVLRRVAEQIEEAEELAALNDTDICHAFKSLMGLYSKTDETFKAKRLALQEKHTNATMAIVTNMKYEPETAPALRTHPLLTVEGGQEFLELQKSHPIIEQLSNLHLDASELLADNVCVLGIYEPNVIECNFVVEKLHELMDRSMHMMAKEFPQVAFRTAPFSELKKIMAKKNMGDLNESVIKLLEAHDCTDTNAWLCLPMFIAVCKDKELGSYQFLGLSRDIDQIVKYIKDDDVDVNNVQNRIVDDNNDSLALSPVSSSDEVLESTGAPIEPTPIL